jgi:dTDP-4-dehydrorhamnose 3,5-epimerase
MQFLETPLSGVWVIEVEPIADERGFFARSFCREEFAARGLNPNLVQCNISFNKACGTLRGMHWQAAPHGEAKLVRCTMGRIYDVALDLRHDSPSFLQWFAVELTAQNRKMLYLPEGCAHGLQTLEDNSEVFYQMSTEFHGPSARGARFDDPIFGIVWPLPITVISAKDAALPYWTSDE